MRQVVFLCPFQEVNTLFFSDELTTRELSALRKAVIGLCANYDSEYGCLPLDSDCYMLGLAYRSSPQCRYFRDSVLPQCADLHGVFSRENDVK